MAVVFFVVVAASAVFLVVTDLCPCVMVGSDGSVTSDTSEFSVTSDTSDTTGSSESPSNAASVVVVVTAVGAAISGPCGVPFCIAGTPSITPTMIAALAAIAPHFSQIGVAFFLYCPAPSTLAGSISDSASNNSSLFIRQSPFRSGAFSVARAGG